MGLMLELLPSLGPALVVGGGAVAARKAESLAAAGFAVTVVSPSIVKVLTGRPGFTLRRRAFVPADVAGHAVVFACTGDREVNRLVGQLAREAGVPVVVADSQDESTAFSPAVHRDGDLQVAVSTHGASPAVAAQVRDQIAASLGDGWAERVEAARAARAEKPRRPVKVLIPFDATPEQIEAAVVQILGPRPAKAKR
jgi:siroheme synthase-like protein